jgi:hypothetical protein
MPRVTARMEAAMLACIIGAVLARVAHAEPPTVLLVTNFMYYDHHWIQWTPTHPVYESIEAEVITGEDGSESIRVFFSERAEGKQQVFYFSDPAIVQRWRVGQAFTRDIQYSIGASSGRPRDLHVSLTDKDGKSVRWDIVFNEDQPLTTARAGLRISAEHSRDFVYLLLVRGNGATALTSTLLIGDDDHSFQPAPGERPPYRFSYGQGAAYTADYYNTTLRLGHLACSGSADGFACPTWQTFTRMSEAPATLYRSAVTSPGWRNWVEVETTQDGAVVSHRHHSGEHVLRVDFEPPLPPLSPLQDGQRYGYRFSWVAQTNLVEGVLVLSRQADAVRCEWQHRKPDWLAERPLVSHLRRTADDGYELTVARQ